MSLDFPKRKLIRLPTLPPMKIGEQHEIKKVSETERLDFSLLAEKGTFTDER